MIGLGVIGLGAIAAYYLAAAERSTAVRLTAVCDTDERRLSPLAKRIFTTADYRSLIASPDVDAVVIAAPNHVHHELCAAALLHCCHVCCEKPLTLAPAAAAELQAIAGGNGVVLFTALHRRYNRNLLRLTDRLGADRRAHGRVVYCRVRYMERIEDHCGSDCWYLDPGACGGGCISDNGPNAFDLCQLLLGPCLVAHAVLERSAPRLERRAVVRLRSLDGVPARVELDWSYPHGELKDVELHYADGYVARADLLEGFSGFKSSLAHEYAAILDDFAVAIEGRPHGGAGGPALVRLVEQAYAAAGEAERVEFQRV